MTVSVILPVFNGVQTLRATLDSLLNQSYEAWDCWIINDGSTDGTADLLTQYWDGLRPTLGPHRLHILHQENQGVIASRNRGIAAAQGEYLAFLDADDLWLPDKLAQQVAVLEQRPDAGAVYCWNDYIDGQGQLLRRGGRTQVEGWVHRALIERNFIETPSNLMVRRAAAQAIGGFDPHLRQLEDWDFNLRLAQAYPIACLPQVKTLYRKTPSSRSTQVSLMEQTGMTILTRALAQLPPDTRRPIAREAWSQLYSYLFYVGFQKPPSRSQALALGGLFLRGLARSPRLWQRVPKRWLGTLLLWGLRGR